MKDDHATWIRHHYRVSSLRSTFENILPHLWKHLWCNILDGRENGCANASIKSAFPTNPRYSFPYFTVKPNHPLFAWTTRMRPSLLTCCLNSNTHIVGLMRLVFFTFPSCFLDPLILSYSSISISLRSTWVGRQSAK